MEYKQFINFQLIKGRAIELVDEILESDNDVDDSLIILSNNICDATSSSQIKNLVIEHFGYDTYKNYCLDKKRYYVDRLRVKGCELIDLCAIHFTEDQIRTFKCNIADCKNGKEIRNLIKEYFDEEAYREYFCK